MSATDPVAGRRVLVTRPAERAAGLAAAIAAAGGEPVELPTIEIVALAPTAQALEAIRRADIIVFTSPAAVAHGVDPLGLRPGSGAPLGTVGPGTTAALRERGFDVAIEALGSADSEGLLRTPALAPERVAGRRVVIVRGQDGREALASELMARGASVHYADVYRRKRPQAPDPGLAGACDIVTATSNEGLANLLAMFDARGQTTLLARPLVVSSTRAAALARERGFTHEPEIADAPGDEALLAAIRRCAARFPPAPDAAQLGPSESA